MAKMVFSADSYSWQEYNTPDTGVHTFDYTITDDGKISYSNSEESGDTGLISVESVESDYLKVCEDGDCNTYMFYDEAKAQSFVDTHNRDGSNSLDLATLLVGKTLYLHAIVDGVDGAEELTFGSDNKMTYKEIDGEIEEGGYAIDGNVVTTYEDEEDGEEVETHTVIESTDKYIKFDEGDGETSTFYYDRDDALNAPVSYQSGQRMVSNVISGHVTFKDSNDNTIAVPSDAWVRVVPTEYQEDGNWNGFECKVGSNGSFGEECYLEGDDAEVNGIIEIFQADNTTYQVAVYKNHIEPDSHHHWNCGEDVYNYVGDKVSSSSWENIIVYPNDYQDRSSEICD